MFVVPIGRPDDVEAFRLVARRLLAERAAPDQVLWQADPTAHELFGANLSEPAAEVRVPAAFIRLALNVACHRDPMRWSLLYEALWRINRGERRLLEVGCDRLVHRLQRMQTAVQRDAHRLTAFVRFRSVGEPERFVAWHESAHRVLRLTTEFFVGRFATMCFSILTPDECLHWDRHAQWFSPGVACPRAPSEDAWEGWWQDYYRATFNPARANPALLDRHMPRRFRRNLPEAREIASLLVTAERRQQRMIGSPACIRASGTVVDDA